MLFASADRPPSISMEVSSFGALPPMDSLAEISSVPNLSTAQLNVPESASTSHTVATLSSPWQFDDTADRCTSCRNSFNAINRKHHCRLCGKIFCGNCSQDKALIPPSSIVLVPMGGKKTKTDQKANHLLPDGVQDDPDRMLTYLSENKELLYGKGLEERFLLARSPLRVCRACFWQLQPLQQDLRNTNSNAVRYNTVDPSDPIKRLLNSPLAFTLGHEIRKAAYTLNNLLPLPKRLGAFVESSHPLGSVADHCDADMCHNPTLGNLDGIRIPARLLQHAKGLAVMTVLKTGFGFIGSEVGTGLVVAKRADGSWSAPCAIGCAGVSTGLLVGAQITDHVFCLMTEKAVKAFFCNDHRLQLGADLGVAVGPVGRAFEVGTADTLLVTTTPVYTYSLGKGLYAGLSLDGKVVSTRHHVNEVFYGRKVTGDELLRGDTVPTPPAAQPLYDALQRCRVYTSSDQVHNATSHYQHLMSAAWQRHRANEECGEVEGGESMVVNDTLVEACQQHLPHTAIPHDLRSGISDLTSS